MLASSRPSCPVGYHPSLPTQITVFARTKRSLQDCCCVAHQNYGNSTVVTGDTAVEVQGSSGLMREAVLMYSFSPSHISTKSLNVRRRPPSNVLVSQHQRHARSDGKTFPASRIILATASSVITVWTALPRRACRLNASLPPSSVLLGKSHGRGYVPTGSFSLPPWWWCSIVSAVASVVSGDARRSGLSRETSRPYRSSFFVEPESPRRGDTSSPPRCRLILVSLSPGPCLSRVFSSLTAAVVDDTANLSLSAAAT